MNFEKAKFEDSKSKELKKSKVFNLEELAKTFLDGMRISRYFSITPERLLESTKKAIAQVLEYVDDDNIETVENLLRQTPDYIIDLMNKIDTQYLHGTGTDSFFEILKKEKIIRRGDGFGGADVEMGHEIDKNEEGKEESYISLCENKPEGHALSYMYARNFEKSKGDSFLFDADKINKTNIVIEQFNALSDEAREKFEKVYGFTKENLKFVADRIHYFSPVIEREKIGIYKYVIDALEKNNIPNIKANNSFGGEIHHLIGKVSNQEIIDIIFSKIAAEKEKYPNTPDKKFVDEYKKLLEKTESRLNAFEKMSQEEKDRKTNQSPVILVLGKSSITAPTTKTTKRNGTEESIHPSGQEARVFGDIDLFAIEEVRVPLKVLPKIQEAIDMKISETSDEKLKEHLRNIKLIPLELYEIERVIRKNINREQG